METRCIWESVQPRVSFLSACPVRAGGFEISAVCWPGWELAGLGAENWRLSVPRADRGCPWPRETRRASAAPKARVGVGSEPGAARLWPLSRARWGALGQLGGRRRCPPGCGGDAPLRGRRGFP